ncbi:MAG: haloacid dehalogenase-like hydrolase [Gammaproteobacteria bacterium]|nr:haloacid dehalogenase-like hydrolase [Gammaproteobacteria bacterium]
MKKTVVVDLDGSLIKLNSFRYWIFFSFVFLLVSLRWISLIKLIKSVIYRFLGISNRVMMKRDILSVTENMSRFYIKWFCHFLYYFTNNDVLNEMRKYEKKHVPVILCTAAPSCYADVFAERFSFSYVFSSGSVFDSLWKENIGEEKWESVRAYYGNDIVLECVITDHHDDLPLLLRAKKRVLVKPSKDTIDKVKGYIDFEVL